MELKLAFYHGRNSNPFLHVFNTLVRLWTFGKYSHCELIVTKGSSDPSDWVWYSAANKNKEGTRKKHIDPDPDKWHIYDIYGVGISSSVVPWMEDRLGKRYDWLGIILSQFIPLGIGDPAKWFCSEFVSAALKHTGNFHILHDNPHCYSPNRLYRVLSAGGLLSKHTLGALYGK